MFFFDSIEEKAKKDGIQKRIAGGIITNEEGKVLFLKRKTDDFMGGIFELPSGNIELGEKISDGLIREIKEETNLDVTQIGLFINTFDYLSRSGKMSRQFNFEVKADCKSEIFLTEHDEYKWLTFEEILNEKTITEEVKYSIEIYKYNKEMAKMIAC